MNWKVLIAGAMFFGALLTVRASDPMTGKEIAMLLRNGEQEQFIIDDTARRKMLKPLSAEEEADLTSLGATPSLLKALRAPAMIATPEDVADYNRHLLQKDAALKQEQLDQARLAQQAQAAALLQKQAQEQARAKPAANDYAGRPLELKFTAADGSPVDLANLRGKVVLIDFWATWCGPCMGEVPNVVATYKKYHDKGFEVIGISLDENKDAMLKVTAEKEMTWPQYFDGKGWKNKISSSFHIQAIPAMWLVNKKGIIDTVDARGKLDAEVAKLLDE